jgi:RND family efflux transporter MFP subunit
MIRRTFTPLQIGLALAGGAVLALFAGQKFGFFLHTGSAPVAFKMPVPVVPVEKRTIPVIRDFIGTTEAIRNVTLQAQVTGYLKSQLVPDGSDVREGTLIYRIDPRNFQASLDQAMAQKERDAASLEYARANQKRNELMVTHGDVSRDAYQLATSSMHQANATLLSDKAAVELARINLGYTMIRAPFTGRLSRSQVYTGTLISTGTVINTLVQLDPLYATFNPAEIDLPAIEQARKRGIVRARVRLSNSGNLEYKGVLTFLDNAVDRSTGTVTARITIRNPDETLIPGEFVHILLHVGEHDDALLVPQIAVGSSEIGKYVYVVGKGDKVEMRLVTLGIDVGSQVEVIKGVREGEEIIAGNLQKIGPGMPVAPILPKKATGN